MDRRRVTIGWLSWEQQGQLTQTFRMAAVASLILGVFSLMLPAIPPTRSGEKGNSPRHPGARCARSAQEPFLPGVLPVLDRDLHPLAFYYNFTNLFLNEEGVRSAAAVQSLGQVSEVLFLLFMPFLLVRVGVKITLAIGMAAWRLRYVFFAFGDAGTPVLDASPWHLPAVDLLRLFLSPGRFTPTSSRANGSAARRRG